MEPASQKETSPLDRFAINSLPHKSSAFVPQCKTNGSSIYKIHIVFHKMEPASQKETSPLDRFAINSLPHKSSAFVPQCKNMDLAYETSIAKNERNQPKGIKS